MIFGTKHGIVRVTWLLMGCCGLLMGVTCPPETPAPPPGTTPLVNQNQNLGAVAGCQAFLDGAPAAVLIACQATLSFKPTEAGKTINVFVGGDISASRIQVQVFDAGANIVMDFDNPTSNTSSSSFVSTSTGLHALVMTETAFPSSLYSTRVDQLP